MRKLAFIALTLCCNPASAEELSAGRIQNELVGQTIIWWESSGWLTGHLVLLPDGRAKLAVESPRPANDVGQWTIRGNEICTAWNSMRAGNSKCYSIQETETGHFITSGGNEFEVPGAGV